MSNALVPTTPSRLIALDALAPEEIDDVLRLAENAKSPNTRMAYDSDWRQFTAWMHQRDQEPLPAPVGLLCAYVAHLKDRGLRASSIGRAVASIAHYHRQGGYDPPPTQAPAFRQVMQGIRRELGTAPRPKSPLIAKLLMRLLKACPYSVKGTRDKAMLAVGFAAALRRSEVVGIDVEHLTWVPQGVRLRIPRSKTDQQGLGQEIAIPTGNFIRPCELIKNWLAVSGITSGPLFRPVNRGGEIADTRLGDDAYVRMIKRRCMAARIDPSDFSGHSLRSGYVSTAVDGDAPPLKIAEVTRHKSLDMLLVYSRRSNLFTDHSGGTFL